MVVPLNRFVLALACAGCLFWVSQARADVVIDDSFAQLDVSDFWQYQLSQYIDADARPPTQGYAPVTPRPDAFQVFGNAYWLRLTLRNDSAEELERWLVLEHNRIYRADLSTYQDGRLVDRQQQGLALPNTAADIPTGHPVFRITLPSQSAIDLYLHIETRDNLFWQTTLWAPEAYTKSLTDGRLLLGLLLGVIGVMAMFNLALGAITRQLAYLHLGLFLSTLLILQLIVHGIGFVYLWPDHPSANRYLLGPSIMLFGMFLLIFSHSFLEAPNRGFTKVLRTITAAFTVVFIIPVATVGSGKAVMAASLMYTAPVLLTCAWAAKQALLGSRPAKQFCFALAPLLAVLLLLLVIRLGNLSLSPLTGQLLLLAGSALSAVALAVALAQRIRTLSKEQNRAQQSATIAKFEAQQANAKAEAAEQAAQAKSVFLATMSHEIRTPMNGVLGMADLLRQSELTSQQTAYIETLKRCGQALMGILNDILDYSKVEAGHMALESIPLDLAQLLDDVVMLYRETINQRGLKLYVWLDPDVPRQIRTDPTRLQQILSNLLSNAIKFTDSGAIHLSVRVCADAHQPAQHIEVCVADQGVGMDQAALETLFERFSQADASISRRFGGTGLGLAICKSLVELMGGSIHAESEPGLGTKMTFTVRAPSVDDARGPGTQPSLFYVGQDADLAESLRLFALREHGNFERVRASQAGALPAQSLIVVEGEEVPDEISGRVLRCGQELILPLVAAELRELVQPSTEPVLASQAQPLSKLSILVAEDNAVNRLVVGKMLKGCGAKVSYAENGRQAVESFTRQHDKLDLILMDCEMPELDGFAATAAIRSSGLLEADIPIIALTAHALDEYRERAAAVGMNGYVTKPINTSDLIDAITSVHSTPTDPAQAADRR